MDMAAVNVLAMVKLVRGWGGWTMDVPLARFRPGGVSGNPAGWLRLCLAGDMSFVALDPPLATGRAAGR